MSCCSNFVVTTLSRVAFFMVFLTLCDCIPTKSGVCVGYLVRNFLEGEVSILTDKARNKLAEGPKNAIRIS